MQTLHPATSTLRTLAYVGTNTNPVDKTPHGEGIYLFEADQETGRLSPLGLCAKLHNASWMCFYPSGRYLYAVHDHPDSTGAVSAYTADPSTGQLTLLNTVSSKGIGPAHLSIDPSGSYLLVANYVDAGLAVLPVLANGSLGEAVYQAQQSGPIGSTRATSAPSGSFAISGHDAPHPHMIQTDPDNRFVLQTDLGQDRIYIYHWSRNTGQLMPAAASPFVSLPDGDGPRHFAFHPVHPWLYSIQEEASTIAFFHFDRQTGSLTLQETLSTLPPGFAGTSFCSTMAISADGHFLYAANRLHNSITVFSIDESGHLEQVGLTPTFGDYPNHFSIDPAGCFLYVCNHRSDQVTTFRIKRDSGLLTFTGQYTPVGTPACIVFAPR